MYGVRHLLDGESLSDDMRPMNGGVLHEHLYLLAKQLLVDVPHNRVAIHRHAGVLGVIDK